MKGASKRVENSLQTMRLQPPNEMLDFAGRILNSKQQTIIITDKQINENRKRMKAMTRQQLAACAGVSTRTLRQWLRPYRQQLRAMGMPDGKQTLPPNIVEWIARKFCIDVHL